MCKVEKTFKILTTIQGGLMTSLKTRYLFEICSVGLLLGAGCSHRHESKNAEASSGVAALIRYEYAPKEIENLCSAAIADAQSQLEKIAATPKAKQTVENTLLQFENVFADLNDKANPLTFMSSVSMDAGLRSEAEECEKKWSEFSIGVFARRDFYDALRNAKARTAGEKRLQKETLTAFEKSGLKFSDAVVNEVKELSKKLSNLKTTFGANLANDNTTVSFTEQELEGTPADFISRLKKDADGKLIVTTKYPDYLAVMENAKNSDTRKRMSTAYQNRQGEKNTKLLEEAIILRQQIAKKLKFQTWADYAIKGRMAKDATDVFKFLNGLKNKLAQANRSDLAKLLKFKQEMEPGATKLNVWDLAYYEYQLKKRDYSLDNEKIREYFPSDHVVKGTFAVYAKLLGVNFVQVPNAKVWGPEVQLYEIRESKSNELLAHFYTDLVPRDGKYGHAAAFPVHPGRLVNGVYKKPIASMVANFEPPANGKPSLLNHDEVETFFHEFGHIMHQTLTKAPFASLSGSSVYQDFVEAPSQMLENWVWDKEVLPTLSGHYTDTSKKLPAEMLNKMLEVRYFNKGYFYTRQLMLGLFDMRIHTTDGPVDTKKVYDNTFRELVGIEPLVEGHFPAGFGHMMGGYEAAYYGYLWSEVYARDMFSRFQEEGLLNAKTGEDYRRHILEQGDMEEPMLLLTRFLGRKPNNKAFIKMLDFKSN